MFIITPQIFLLLMTIFIGIHVPVLINRLTSNTGPLLGYARVPLLGYSSVPVVGHQTLLLTGNQTDDQTNSTALHFLFKNLGSFHYILSPQSKEKKYPVVLYEPSNRRFYNEIALHFVSSCCAALMVVIALLARLKLASWRGRVYVEGEVINVGWKKFKILGILGEGGQAFLYKVNNGTDIFAAKLALSWSPIALYHEYTVLSKLFHPNIITVHQRIPRGYIMECLSSDLCSLLENTNDLSPDLRDTISYGMIQAVGYLHSCRIAHLDIKPDNILLTTSLVPKLADFGLAKSYVNADGSVGLFNFRCGSFHYMPPEMYLRNAPFDLSKSDCWSLGVCFFVMLTGVVPFSGSNDKELLSNQLNQRYDIPANMAALIRFDEPYSRYMGMIVHLCTVDSTARFSAAEAFSFYWKET